MDRVPVAVQGGDAADRRGLVGSLPLPEPAAHPISLLSGRPALGLRQWEGHQPGLGSPGAQAQAQCSPSSWARMMALYQPSLRKGDAGLSTRWVWTQPVAPSTCSQSSGS